MRQILLKSFLSALLLFSSLALFSQPGGGGPGGGAPPPVPIPFAGILLAAGAAFGVKKILDNRKDSNKTN